MSGGYDGSIKIDSSIDSKGFNKGMSGMSASLKGLALAVGVAFSVGAIVAFGKAAVDAASEIQSAYIGLQSIVEGQGKSFMGAKSFIQDYIADGLVPASNAVTAYKNLLMRGYDTKQIEAIMNVLKNSSAFGRQSSLTLGQAVQSATEGLKNENSILVDNAGVTKNVSMMWKDYAATIGTTAGMLTIEQKREAEFQGIMQETRFQMGDAAKLSQTYAGKVASLSVSFTNLKVAIGNSIIPIINQILPYIKMAIDALVIFFNTVAQIMNALFGTSVSMASVASEMETAATATDAVANNADNAADSQNKLAKNTDKAAKAAKGATAAFDDLNVLQQTDTSISDAGGTGGGAIGGGAIAAISAIDPSGAIDEGLGNLEARVEIFKTKLISFLQPVSDALGRLRDALIPLGETIWEGLKWAWDNILVPLGAWAITDLLPVFLDLLAGAAELLNSVLIALQPVAEWLWEEFLQPLATWTGGAIISIIENLTKALIKLSDWIDAHPDLFHLIVVSIGALAFAIWLTHLPLVGLVIDFGFAGLAEYAYLVSTALATSATWALNAALAFLTSPLLLITLLIAGIIVVVYLLIRYWDDLSVTVTQLSFIISNTVDGMAKMIKSAFFIMLDKVKEKFTEAWEYIKYIWGLAVEWFKVYVIDPVKNKFTEVWETVKMLAFLAWEFIKTTWKNAIAWFTTNVILPMQSGFSRAWELIKSYASDAWSYITNLFSSMSAWVRTNITDPLKNAFGTALDWINNKWHSIFDGIVNFTRGILNSIIRQLNNMLNGAVEGLNVMIESINNVGSYLGIPTLGYISAPQIPYLASGAVIPPNAQFLAMLGDQRNGRNIEAPESLIRQIVREEGGGNQTITINFEGTLSALMRELKPYADKENARIGGNLITSGTTV